MRIAARVVIGVVAAGVGCGSAQSNHARMSPREIVDASCPAIVRIETSGERVGTGFILDRSGLIATNLHVIEGELAIKVKLFDGRGEYPVVSIAGVDRDHDLALMWIHPRGALPAVRLGDSRNASAGDRVYAIGNPLGMDYSITDGLISQVRHLSPQLTILQISAPISPGSSGGPLFNQFGEVIGVTTMIVAQGQNINLAVPADYLRPMMRQPKAIGLGEFAQVTMDLAKAHGEDSEDRVEIHRQVPRHPLAVLGGCDRKDIDAVVTAIEQAIQNGAPLYNTGTPAGFEACYRIYEGTALRFEKDSGCKGLRAAFGDGLLRATSLPSFKEKAWAMRDAFDGVIDVARRWSSSAQRP